MNKDGINKPITKDAPLVFHMRGTPKLTPAEEAKAKAKPEMTPQQQEHKKQVDGILNNNGLNAITICAVPHGPVDQDGKRTLHWGISLCSKTENFKRKMGIEIALGRVRKSGSRDSCKAIVTKAGSIKEASMQALELAHDIEGIWGITPKHLAMKRKRDAENKKLGL